MTAEEALNHNWLKVRIKPANNTAKNNNNTSNNNSSNK